MSSDTIKEILDKLSKLRILDNMLDFAKASTQLDILVALSDNKPVSLDELALKVGRGKRQVADAIRKMLRKGFVRYETKDNETLIMIDTNGLDYLKGISDVLSIDVKNLRTNLDSKKIEVTENIGAYFYVYETLTILGTAQRPLSLNKLASIIGISPNRLESYLDLFVSQDDMHKNIFEKVYKISYGILRFKRTPKTLTYYKLSEVGIKVFYKLPFYMRYKNSITMQFLTKIMFMPHYKTALNRFIKFYMIGTITILFMLLIPYGWILAAAWLFFSIITLFMISLEL